MGQPEGEGIGTYRRPPTGRTAGLRQTLGPGYRRRRDRSESKATHSTTSTDPTTTHSPVDPAADSSRRRQWLTGTALAVVLAAGVTAVPNVDNPDAGRAPATAGHRHGVQAGPRLLAGGGLPSRQLYGWGGNDAGQVGTGSIGGGSMTGVTTPTAVTAPAGQSFASIASGGAFTVGLTTTGQVFAWGAGSLGQLGDGQLTGSTVPMPVTIPSPPGAPPAVVTAVSAGDSHALALTSSGQVWAWGANLFGQLGNGTTADSDVPVAVTPPPGVVFDAVAAGGDHSLALASDGRIFGWGANTSGQVGDGTTSSRSTPTPVTAPPGVTFTAVSAGTAHSLAVASDGSVWSWGFNASGQLGTGTTTDASTPQQVAMPAGTPVATVAAGGSHSLALTASGRVFAWGSDVFGQLSSALVSTLPVDSDVPVQPLGLPPVTTFVSISAGQDSSYALTSNGVPWGWGGDYYGQLGDGTPGLNAVGPSAMTTLSPGTLATGLFAGPDASAAFLVTRATQSITYPSVGAVTYGDPPLDVAPTVDSGLGVTNSASGSCTGALVRLFIVAAGPCTVTSAQVGSFQYYPASASATFTVAPAVLQVVPDPATGAVGSPLPALTYHLVGFHDGDTASVVSGSATCTTRATTSSFQGTYAITCSVGTLSAANYVFQVGTGATLSLFGASSGYAVFGADGSIWPMGPVPAVHGVTTNFFGSMAGQPLAAPVVGAAYTPFHDGYWEVATDGGIFAFGSARFAGSMGARPLNRPIVGMAATPDGSGYWEVASDGGIFAFGDAGFYGSPGADSLVEPIVGMAATPDGRGYWLVASDGGIFAFGDATFYGSTGGRPSLDPIVAMAATADGAGYWMVTRDGAVFPFGDAAFEGSLRYETLIAPIVGIAPSSDGKGYWLAGADGGVFAFGDAPFLGAVSAPPAPAAGII